MISGVGGRSCCHGQLYELGNLGHLSEVGTKRKVIVDRIGVPVMAFSMSCGTADPEF